MPDYTYFKAVGFIVKSQTLTPEVLARFPDWVLYRNFGCGTYFVYYLPSRVTIHCDSATSFDERMLRDDPTLDFPKARFVDDRISLPLDGVHVVTMAKKQLRKALPRCLPAEFQNCVDRIGMIYSGVYD